MAELNEMPFTPYVKQADLVSTDTTAKKLFQLPANSKIIRIEIQNAALATGGSADVGIQTNTDYFVDGLDIATVASHLASLLISEWSDVPLDIYGLVAFTGAAAGGPFTVILTYINRKSRKVL